MQAANWEKVAEYVSAGNLASVKIDEDFTGVHLEIIYLNGQSREEVQVNILCHGCCYLDLRRRGDHEPGAGIILEAYLHTSSPLTDAFFAHELEGKAGCLFFENTPHREPVKHLEIIGEISVNILCQDISFSWGDQ